VNREVVNFVYALNYKNEKYNPCFDADLPIWDD
jgi:hypothetical protein